MSIFFTQDVPHINRSMIRARKFQRSAPANVLSRATWPSPISRPEECVKGNCPSIRIVSAVAENDSQGVLKRVADQRGGCVGGMTVHRVQVRADPKVVVDEAVAAQVAWLQVNAAVDHTSLDQRVAGTVREVDGVRSIARKEAVDKLCGRRAVLVFDVGARVVANVVRVTAVSNKAAIDESDRILGLDLVFPETTTATPSLRPRSNVQSKNSACAVT